MNNKKLEESKFESKDDELETQASKMASHRNGSIEDQFEDLNLEAHKDPRVQKIVQELTQSKSGASDDEDQSKKNDGDESGSDDSGDENCIIKTNDMIFNPESYLNNWLKKHGKDDYINFSDEDLDKLRTYFKSLDSDGGGSIGIDELEDPLIALGLVDNRSQVQKIMTSVDDDGEIEFREFLTIIRGGSSAQEGVKDDGTTAIYLFFKDLTSGKMNIDGNDHIPFSLFISSQRRRKLIQAITLDPKDDPLQKDGERILLNYKKQLAERLARDHIDNQPMSMPSSKQSKRFGETGMTAKSTKSQKSQRKKDMEEKVQKLVNTKLQDISYFKGEPPDESILLNILKKKTKNK